MSLQFVYTSRWTFLAVVVLSIATLTFAIAIGLEAQRTGDLAQSIGTLLLLGLSVVFSRSVAVVSRGWVIRNPTLGLPLNVASIGDVREDGHWVYAHSGGKWRKVVLKAYSAYGRTSTPSEASQRLTRFLNERATAPPT